MRMTAFALALSAVLAVPAADAATQPPLAGCYQRVYDAAHLAAHKRQLVVRVALEVAGTKAWPETTKVRPFIADGSLKIWIRGRKQSFDLGGACWADGDGLMCQGSLSAAEANSCKSKRDGVHDCRIHAGNPGFFRVAAQGQDVLITIRQRLELAPAPYDDGPFLYLSPTNAENHAFLLKATPGGCKTSPARDAR